MRVKGFFNFKRAVTRDPVAWLGSRPWVGRTLDLIGMKPLGQSTRVWFREAAECHTRVTMRNYLTMSYRIPAPLYQFTLFDAGGQKVTKWERVARPDETLIVDSGSLIKELGLGSRFEGTLGVEVRHQSLLGGRFLRANVDYYGPIGFNTTVHDQGAYISFPKEDVQTLVHVEENEASETGIVLQNGYRYRRNPNEFMAKATIELLNQEGTSLSAHVAPIPAGGMRVAWLSELFPGAPVFLAGKPGGLRIHSNIGMPRSIPVIRSKRNQYIAVSHTVGDMDATLYARPVIPSKEVPLNIWAPIWSSLILESDRYQTAFSLFNNWLPKSPYPLDVRVFDAEGKKVLDAPRAFEVQPNQTYVLKARELLTAHQVKLPFVGSIEARLTPCQDLDMFPGPGIPQVNTIWRSADSIALSNNQSLGAANTDIASGDRMSPKRTKMFGRIICTADCETWISLINLSSEECYSMTSNTQIIVTDASGQTRLERTIHILGHGTFFANLNEMFPELMTFLKDSGGISSLLIVDKQVKLIGYLMLRNRQTGAIGMDHLFGG